jgi:hypothetical protein
MGVGRIASESEQACRKLGRLVVRPAGNDGFPWGSAIAEHSALNRQTVRNSGPYEKRLRACHFPLGEPLDRDPAINNQKLPGDERRLVGKQELDRSDDVLGNAQASEWSSAKDLL